LILPHQYRTLAGGPGGTGGIPTKYTMALSGLELYNMNTDRAETKDVAAAHPEVVQRLQTLAEKGREELGDKITGRVGKGVRPVGSI